MIAELQVKRKPTKTDATTVAAQLNPADTATKRFEQIVGNISPDVVEHSKKFGETVAQHLSGKGLKSDHLAVANHVLETLRGGGLKTRDLLHTYVHGRVPVKRRKFRHPRVTKYHSVDEPFAGGSLDGHTHFLNGEKQSWDAERLLKVHVV